MDYLKMPPAQGLEKEIEAYCFFRFNEKSVISDLYFPNGKPSMVFHLGDPFEYFSLNSNWEIMPRMSLISCAMAPVALNSGRNVDTVAILFNPHTIYNLFKLGLDARYNLIDIEPYIHADLFLHLKGTNCFEQRTALLNTYFAEQLKGYNPEKDLFGKICNYIFENKGNVERYRIAEIFDISENYIHKLFMQRIGVSFKPYSQIIRISNILKEITCLNRADWMEILEKYGYYDQAHFIKDFKKIVKQTPQQYLHLDKSFSAIFSAIA
ncbi:MAG TPA: AraC family transcriptional regulator [Bacteroidales bacterium]|nr:AraC family transcriptional regulator [Bacteroidales bacterium]